MIISLVVAAADNDVIGRDGALPWHLPDDMRRFRDRTTGHVLVMGRITYESILGRLGRPLPDRTSVVVSTTLRHTGDDRVRPAGTLEQALRLAEELAAAAGDDEVFIIGGETLYRQVLPSADRVYLTRVHMIAEGDRSMPAGWLDGFELVDAEEAYDGKTGIGCSYLSYQRAAR